MNKVTLIFISDTHGSHRSLQIPDGDILIHSGDFSYRGTKEEVEEFNKWLGYLPHNRKIVVAGNHDKGLARPGTTKTEAKKLLHNANAIYLEDEEVTIEGLRIYGSPWVPKYGNWSFMLPRNSKELEAPISQIPEGLDILITHGPSWGNLDRAARAGSVGCEILQRAVEQKQPRIHCFGHIHPGYGVSNYHYLDSGKGTIFVNAAICNDYLTPIHTPIVIDLPVLVK